MQSSGAAACPSHVENRVQSGPGYTAGKNPVSEEQDAHSPSMLGATVPSGGDDTPPDSAVLQQLVSMLRRAGGAVPSGVAVKRLYAGAPWARDCVAAAGGFRRLCSAHSNVVELAPAAARGAGVGGGGGHGWVLRLVDTAAGGNGGGGGNGNNSGAGDAAVSSEMPYLFSIDAFPDLSPKVSFNASTPPVGVGNAASTCWGDPTSNADWCGYERDRPEVAVLKRR